MKLDNLSTSSSQPSSCTLKTSSSGWSLATTSKQCAQPDRASPAPAPVSTRIPVSPLKQAIQSKHLTASINTSISGYSRVSGGSSSSSGSGGSVTTPTASISTRGAAQLQYFAGNKFHRAAIDGYVDMLCTASKRDTNCPAQDDFVQLTPTLLAAQAGQLEALRILVGRGGDPERVSALGSSALHLAAARDHLNCVSFLVNFGANMWALDNELRTAKDIAALGQCTRVLEYLDQMMAKQSAINTKLVQKLKDKAKVAAEKRLKQMRKQQLKAIKQVERDERLLAKMSNNRRLLKSAHSTGDIKLVGRREQLTTAGAISFSPNEPLDGSTPLSSSTGGGGGVMSSSKMVANFLSARFQCPPKGPAEPRPGARVAQLEQTTASVHNLDLDSSYCSSSSVSSASGGYLSSCSARSILKSALASRRASPARAIAEESARSCSQRDSAPAKGRVGVNLTGRLAASRRPRYSDLVAVTTTISSGHKSDETKGRGSSGDESSRLSSRLRGLSGGVSRKVHLKRLLFASSTALESRDHDDQKEDELIRAARGEERVQWANDLESQRCQPAGSPLSGASRSDCVPSSLWLKRTRSEPDFKAAMQRVEVERRREHADTCNESECQQDEDERRQPDIPTPPPEPPGLDVREGKDDLDDGDGDRRQQLRLSQLKLCQSKRQQPQKLPLPSSGPNSKQQKSLCTSNSDELLRHQLNASEFPLRPSIIKQQLCKKQQQGQLENCSGQHMTALDNITKRRQKSTTIMSVDSIGSVGSFAQRNMMTEPSSSSFSAQSQQQQQQVSFANLTSGRGDQSGERNLSTSSGLSSSSFGGSAASLPPDPDEHDQTTRRPLDANNNAAHQASAPSQTKRAGRQQSDELLAHFLASHNLSELADVLAQERIDLEALLLLSEADLKSLDILLGPRRKLLNAIKHYKALDELKHERQDCPGAATCFTVVDTQF